MATRGSGGTARVFGNLFWILDIDFESKARVSNFSSETET